jgi:hypothetical protein
MAPARHATPASPEMASPAWAARAARAARASPEKDDGAAEQADDGKVVARAEPRRRPVHPPSQRARFDPAYHRFGPLRE